MKLITFFFSVLFTILVVSCNKNSDDSNNFYDLNDFLKYDYNPESDVLITLDMITSFNSDTKEINIDGMLGRYIKSEGNVAFIYKNKVLFYLPVFSPTFNRVRNDYVVFINDSKFFLYDAYPEIYEEWPDYIKASLLKERDENAKKQKKNWDFFIKYLSENGKYKK